MGNKPSDPGPNNPWYNQFEEERVLPQTPRADESAAPSDSAEAGEEPTPQPRIDPEQPAAEPGGEKPNLSGLANLIEHGASGPANKLESTGTGLAEAFRSSGSGLAGKLREKGAAGADSADGTATGLAYVVEQTATGLAFAVEQTATGLAYAVDQTGISDLVERHPTKHSRMGLFACIMAVLGAIMLARAMPIKGLTTPEFVFGFVIFVAAGCLLGLLGFAMAIIPLVRKTTLRTLPMTGLALNFLALGALAVLVWWPTPARMIDSVRHGRLGQVQLALKLDVPVDAREMKDFTGINEGETALTAAAASNQIGAINLLLDHGAFVDGRDGQMDTPLYRAVDMQNLDAARELLENGANPNISCHAKTPIYQATDHSNMPLVYLLLAHGADLDEGPPWPLFHAVQRDNVETAQALLIQGARPNLVEPGTQNTPLHQAARNGNRQMVQLLLSFGANPNVISRGNRTAADAARSAGHEGLADWLAGLGEQVEDPFIAIGQNRPKALGRLINAPAIQNNHSQAPYGLNLVQLAALLGREACVKTLLEAGFAADQVQETGDPTPLHLAAQRGHEPVVMLLAGSNIDVEQPATGRYWQGSPAFAAYAAGANETAKTLFMLFASRIDTVGQIAGRTGTPMFFAVARQDRQFLRDLLKLGADPNAHGPESVPPLFEAVRQGNAGLVALLVASGADPNLAIDGKTALDLAHEYAPRSKKFAEVVEVLTNRPDQRQAMNSTTGG